MTDQIYILAFWPHPDDVDMGCGGTLYKTAQQGKHNVIVDLTCSQMSTRWTPKQRLQEAQNAAEKLWIHKRINLGLTDLEIKDDNEHRQIIIKLIRTYRPEIILFPNFNDRHPDHEATAQLIKNSIFMSGLEKFGTAWLEPYRPRLAMEYMIWDDFEPSLIIGLEQQEFDAKLNAINEFQSQIATNQRADNYLLGKSIKLGRSVGTPHAEGFRLYQGWLWIDSFDTVYTRAF